MESNSHTSCPVCHEGIEVLAVGCCDHAICYRCSCRMRVLCEQFYCPICRTDLPQVYLIKDDLKYNDIPRHGYIPNRKNKIFFQNDKIRGLFDKLLENRCKMCTHARPERTFKDLQNHIRKQHGLFYCDLCIDHLKLFPSERKYYSRHDLAVHRRLGDKDDSSYKGHPLCVFCDERYMDNDELYRHLRKEHFFCHFCDPEGSSEFYNDYPSLRNHFHEKHYLCQEGACSGAEVRLTHAFRSKIDFQAHTAAEHASNLTKAQAKQMRTIDINYQLPPRDRRRDRGVVNAADYEDTAPIQTKVFHNSRGSRGHAGRQRYEESRGFKKGNFSEEDVQRAINASLDVMKEVEKKEEPKEMKEEEKIVHDRENFPVLGNVKSEHLRVDSPVDSDHKDSDSEALDFSMAKQIALKNKRSVQYGRLMSNEFPTLSGEAPTKDTVNNSANNVVKPTPIQPPKTQQPVSTKKESVSKPTSKFTKAITKGPAQSEDFPGLPTKSTSSSAILGSASWVPKPGKDNKQTKKMPVQITMNDTNKNDKTVSSKGSKKSQQKFQDDNDFPTLGGPAAAAAAVNTNWLQKSLEKNKSKPEKKSIDWFDADDNFEFSIENVTKQTPHYNTDDIKTNSSDTKKKKKKKDKSKASGNESENISKLTKDVSSLDSIASCLLSSNKDTEPKPETTKVDSPKTVKKEELKRAECQKSLIKEESERVESPTEYLKKEKKSSKPIEVDENKFSLLNEDFDMKLLCETEPFKIQRKKDVVIKLDDFPTLGASKAPPPGFAKPLLSNTSSSTKTPPGFTDVSSSKRPPPGFATSTEQNGHVASEANKCSFTLKNIMPMMTEMSNFDFVPPDNSKERNQQLIQDIKNCLGENLGSFDEFKSVSAAFRQGSTNATDYYSQCEKLIGKDNFDRIFPELLVLLPDIGKQQELLSTYKTLQDTNKGGNVIRISGKSVDAPWKQTANFQSCPTCRQVLLSSDITSHASVHGSTSDFPSIGGGSSGVALRAFVKGKQTI